MMPISLKKKNLRPERIWRLCLYGENLSFCSQFDLVCWQASRLDGIMSNGVTCRSIGIPYSNGIEGEK